jgi:phosphoserine phosphatase
MGVRIAVFDMDGTLFGGLLAEHMTRALMSEPTAGEAAVGRGLEILRRYRTGDISHDDCAAVFYPAYQDAVRGMSVIRLSRIGASVWRRHRDALFPHAHGVVSVARRRGLLTCLLSGSPEEVVSVAARDLGIDRWWGMTITAHAGVSTGQVSCAPARRGAKAAVLEGLAREIDVDWDTSFAMGNSAADIEVLAAVGTPVAFEPEPQLRHEATRRGWTITNRGDVLQRTTRLLNPSQPIEDA